MTAEQKYYTNTFIVVNLTAIFYNEKARSVTLYAYCGNDPIMFIDPDGNEPKPDGKKWKFNIAISFRSGFIGGGLKILGNKIGVSAKAAPAGGNKTQLGLYVQFDSSKKGLSKLSIGGTFEQESVDRSYEGTYLIGTAKEEKKTTTSYDWNTTDGTSVTTESYNEQSGGLIYSTNKGLDVFGGSEDSKKEGGVDATVDAFIIGVGAKITISSEPSQITQQATQQTTQSNTNEEQGVGKGLINP